MFLKAPLGLFQVHIFLMQSYKEENIQEEYEKLKERENREIYQKLNTRSNDCIL